MRRFLCGSCDQIHTGIPEVSFRRPDAVVAMPPADRRRTIESDDGCVVLRRAPGLLAAARRVLVSAERRTRWGGWGWVRQDNYLRCVLRLPLLDPAEGDGDSFGFGPWAQVSAEDYDAEFDRSPGELPWIECTLATELPGYPGSLGLRVRAETQPPGLRPLLTCLDGGTLLAREQRSGITTARALEILAVSAMDPQWLGQGAWTPAEGGSTIGTPGPDGGTVELDDEYEGRARITLARGESGGCSITCGVDGLFVHTRFLPNAAEGPAALPAMKEALGVIADLGDTPAATAEAEGFVRRFP